MTENREEIVHVWKEQDEKILIDWADKATCYRWLHNKAHSKYSCRNMWFTIPVIIISTLTGTANFASQHIPIDYQKYYSMGIGGFNIFAGIVTTISQFLKLSELNEAHRVSSISWAKFNRNIKVELAKSPDDRDDPKLMLKRCNEEYDRLIETSPNIPTSTLKLFKMSFGDRKYGVFRLFTSVLCCNCRKLTDEDESELIKFMKVKEHELKLKKFAKVSKPEICDILVSVDEFKYKENELSSRNIKIITNKDRIAKHKKEIKEYITQFEKAQSRKPTKEELKEQFSELVNSKYLSVILTELYPVKEL